VLAIRLFVARHAPASARVSNPMLLKPLLLALR
jgi:hypothetical protein